MSPHSKFIENALERELHRTQFQRIWVASRVCTSGRPLGGLGKEGVLLPWLEWLPPVEADHTADDPTMAIVHAVRKLGVREVVLCGYSGRESPAGVETSRDMRRPRVGEWPRERRDRLEALKRMLIARQSVFATVPAVRELRSSGRLSLQTLLYLDETDSFLGYNEAERRFAAVESPPTEDTSPRFPRAT